MHQGYVSEIWRYPVKSMAGEQLGESEVGERGLWGDRGWAVLDEVTGDIRNAKRFPVLMQCSAVYRARPTFDSVPDVDVTLPDGSTLGSDSPALSERLSELMARRVSLQKVRPATDTAFYRRREPGSALIGRLAGSRQVRRGLTWAVHHGLAGGGLREDFGRETGEPLPDLADNPSELFEFQTPPGTFFDVYPIQLLTTSTLHLMRQLNPAADWDVRRFRPNVLIDSGAETKEQIEGLWAGQRIHVGGFVAKGELPTVRCAMPMHAQRGLPRDPSVLRTIVRQANQCLGLYASVAQPGAVALGAPVVTE